MPFREMNAYVIGSDFSEEAVHDITRSQPVNIIVCIDIEDMVFADTFDDCPCHFLNALNVVRIFQQAHRLVKKFLRHPRSHTAFKDFSQKSATGECLHKMMYFQLIVLLEFPLH